ncbi:hypothetical protein HMPREF0971_02702 [Segatella oris F0302]|uniref:Uncharacterized protein n=1 Tax=Segatella oris F0302 TaxID=649760 RepID=D1QUL7_9BACT|nr:hypothetical protein HMPREF0971_02702 [Segatella oris F0302]
MQITLLFESEDAVIPCKLQPDLMHIVRLFSVKLCCELYLKS